MPGVFRISLGDSSAKGLAVTKDWSCEELPLGSSDYTLTDDGGTLTLRFQGEVLTVLSAPEFEPYEVTRKGGGSILTRDTVDGVRTMRTEGKTHTVRTDRHARLSFTVDDAPLFGLGSHEEGYACLNGRTVRLYQENMRIAVPFFVSARGYACLIDNASYMCFDNSEPSTIRLYIDAAENVTLYLLTGSYDHICQSYRELTGPAPLLPKWSFGYIQSKERYIRASELPEVVSEYRKRRVPLDGIVQDWFYWKDGQWGEKVLDPARYEDLADCLRRVHDMGAHAMISIWPNMIGGSNHREMEEAGFLLPDGSVYNAFSEEARALYWKQAEEGLFRHGIDAWWCDSSEPYDAVWGGEVRPEAAESCARSVSEFKNNIDDSLINAYSLFHSRGIYENQRKVSTKRVLNLTRSAFAGQHRYGTVVWSGDVSASWETLRRQVHILQNYCSSGEAYWNSDIGGFFTASAPLWFRKGEYNNGCEDPLYRELYTRWLQFAAFTPMMRSHGSDTPREIWHFGEAGTPFYDAIAETIRFRTRLVPYLYSLSAAYSMYGKAMIKPLALSYPGVTHHKAYEEFMLGDLLVCPVTKPGITSMEIFLPEGLWYDLYSGRCLQGGLHTVSVTLQTIPVFARAGAIIPTVRTMQYTDEVPNAPYEVYVYDGADGDFLLYDDAGDGYDYENGACCLSKLHYDSGRKKITVAKQGDRSFAHELRLHIISGEYKVSDQKKSI